MEFSIGTQFSREFNIEETLLIRNRLNDSFNGFFKQKDYSSDVKKIHIGIICVSKGFEPFFMVRPLKILKKEAALEYEIKVDYDSFFNSSEEERLKILFSEFLNMTTEIFSVKKIKGFDSLKFLEDLKEFVNANK